MSFFVVAVHSISMCKMLLIHYWSCQSWPSCLKWFIRIPYVARRDQSSGCEATKTPSIYKLLSCRCQNKYAAAAFCCSVSCMVLWGCKKEHNINCCIVAYIQQSFSIIYRSYLFLCVCGNGQLLIDCAINEANSLTDSSSSLAVLKVLQEYSKRNGFRSVKSMQF